MLALALRIHAFAIRELAYHPHIWAMTIVSVLGA
jgi:hypothetical protein